MMLPGQREKSILTSSVLSLFVWNIRCWKPSEAVTCQHCLLLGKNSIRCVKVHFPTAIHSLLFTFCHIKAQIHTVVSLQVSMQDANTGFLLQLDGKSFLLSFPRKTHLFFYLTGPGWFLSVCVWNTAFSFFFRPPAVHTQTTEQLRFVIILVTQSENPKVVSKVAGWIAVLNQHSLLTQRGHPRSFQGTDSFAHELFYLFLFWTTHHWMSMLTGYLTSEMVNVACKSDLVSHNLIWL